MIACLPMYDLAPLQGANDQFWHAIRDALGHGPDGLTRGRDLWEVWRAPDLLLAQTCGLPYRARLHGQVRLVGTPDYGLPGCPPGHYNSVIVLRSGDPRGSEADLADAPFAFNDTLSQSGWAAPQAHMAALGLGIRPVLATGAHVQSARAVAEGRADWAAIDALTWALLGQAEPDLIARLRVLTRTAPTPALPYITGPDGDAEAIFRAIEAAIPALPQDVRDALHLKGIVAIPREAYLAVPIPPEPRLQA